jgi:hypothetical protein
MVWAAIAVLLFLGALVPSEIAIAAYWLNVTWAFPFNLLWGQLTHYLMAWMPSLTAYLTALLTVDIVALLFWFVVLPKFCAALVAKRGTPQ